MTARGEVLKGGGAAQHLQLSLILWNAKSRSSPEAVATPTTGAVFSSAMYSSAREVGGCRRCRVMVERDAS